MGPTKTNMAKRTHLLPVVCERTQNAPEMNVRSARFVTRRGPTPTTFSRREKSMTARYPTAAAAM
jgi:hypothetical protein